MRIARLKIAEHANGMTYEKIGKELGKSMQAINKWNQGESFPSLEVLIQLMALLNCEFYELVEMEE